MIDTSGYLNNFTEPELQELRRKAERLYNACEAEGPNLYHLNMDIMERIRTLEAEESTKAVVTSVCGQNVDVDLSGIDQDIASITFKGKTFRVTDTPADLKGIAFKEVSWANFQKVITEQSEGDYYTMSVSKEMHDYSDPKHGPSTGPVMTICGGRHTHRELLKVAED
ncbi:MAG: hypothetical protein KAS32_21685 [Candidatus Peribacteraceae bacterium]|nr:hypothetical protein [Candidatus Peribacteraceae bacterium]